MKKLFFDTDVILDISIAREMSVKDSVKVLNLVEANICRGYTSSIIFSNVYYVQNKFIRHDASIQFLKNLRRLLTVLNVDDFIIQKALESEFSDFEDAIQYFTAFENGMDYIVTRNIKDYKRSEIPVYTPTELLRLLK